MQKEGLKTITAFIGALLSCVLVVSFGLHTVELSHTHPGGDHHQNDHVFELLSDYMHGAEKKSFLLLLVSLLSLALYVAVNSNHVRLIREFIRLNFFVFHQLHHRYTLHSYLDLLFRKGILHTKSY